MDILADRTAFGLVCSEPARPLTSHGWDLNIISEVTNSITNRRRIRSIILAWLLFIGIDFLFHASIFASFWKEDLPALKSLDELAVLIPAGYISFLLLTSLIGYVFFKVFRTKPEIRKVFQLGFVFAILFSLSNIFALYSYIDIPLKQLMVFNLVYFIEIIAVSLALYYFAFSINTKRSIVISVLIFFVLIIAGIMIQNVFPDN